jgi:hypothetical protein
MQRKAKSECGIVRRARLAITGKKWGKEMDNIARIA